MTSTGPSPASGGALVGEAARYLPADAVVRGSSVRPQAMAAIAAAYVAPVRTLVATGLVAGGLLGLVAVWFGLRQLTDRAPSLVLGVVGLLIGVALVAAAAWFARGLLASGRALQQAQRRWFHAAPSLPAPEAQVLGRGGAVVRLVVAGVAVVGAAVGAVLLLRSEPGTAVTVVVAVGVLGVVAVVATAVAGLVRLHRVAAAAPPPAAADAFAPFPGAASAGPPVHGAGYAAAAPGRSPYGARPAAPGAGPAVPPGPGAVEPGPPGDAPLGAPTGPPPQPWSTVPGGAGPGSPPPGWPSGPTSAPPPAPRHETIAWAEDAAAGAAPAPPSPTPAAPPASMWQPPDTEPAPPGGPDAPAVGGPSVGPDAVEPDVESTRLTRAAAAAVVADTTTRGSRTETVVVLEDGRRLAVDAVSLLGRDPRGRPGEPQVVTVPVEHRTVSRTHASFRVTATSVHVTDRASTNGTSVVAPDGVTRELRAWAEEPVVVGSEVLLGSYRVRVLLAEDAG